MQINLDQLAELGYTVVPDFMDTKLTARVREHIDSLTPPIQPADDPDAGRVHILRHPIPGAIMAELLSPKLLEAAKIVLHANELRLLEQVLIRTDPKPPPHGAGGWHVDWAFLPRHYEARPRQTYYHMVQALNTVPPNGGAFMIVPGSHHQTYATAAKTTTPEELEALHHDPIGVAGIDTSQAIEVRPNDGDLLIFNPMCLHSASGNASTQSRYVYFASFFDVSAKEFWQMFRDENSFNERNNYPDSLREALPKEFVPLLEF